VDQSWHALAGWEARKSAAFCAAKRNARIGVLSSGLDVLILLRVLFYFIYVLLSFGGEYPNVSLKFGGRSRSRCSGIYQ